MSPTPDTDVIPSAQDGLEHANKRLPVLLLMSVVVLIMIGASGIAVLFQTHESQEKNRLSLLADLFARHLVQTHIDQSLVQKFVHLRPPELEGGERFDLLLRQPDGLLLERTRTLLNLGHPFARSLKQWGTKTPAKSWIGINPAGTPAIIAIHEEKESGFILVVHRPLTSFHDTLWPQAGIIALVILFSSMFLVILFWSERNTLIREVITIRNRFQKYYDVGLIGIADTSLETGWLRFNQRLCEILGYSPDELRRTNWVELTHPDDLEEELLEFRRALHGEIAGYTREKRFIRKDGQPFHAMTSLRCVRGEDGKVDYFVTFLFDITDRKNAEEALQKSQRGLARAQELAHLGSWDWDIPANVITWSDETYRIFSLKPQEFHATYEAFLWAVHPDDRQLERTAMSRVLADPGANYSMEYRVVRPDGVVRYVHLLGEIIRNAQGTPLRMEGFIQDITEYKRIESRLRGLNEELEQRVLERTQALEKANVALRGEITERKNAEEKLRALFDNSPDLILTVDRNQEVQFLNRQQPEKFPSMVIGQLLKNVLPDDIFRQCQRCLRRVISTNTAASLQVVCENDTWWEIRMAPISRENLPHSVMMVFTDITEKRTLQVQAIRNARLASLGILAASVAHEINNPNNAIGFSASSLSNFWREMVPVFNDYRQQCGDFELGGMSLEEAMTTLPRLIDGIGRNVERIKRTVDVLKHMGRQDEGKIEEELDILEILRSAISILHAQIGKHTHHFAMNCDLGPITVRGNALQLEQVFINLIQNALQALPNPECSVTVDVRPQPNQGKVQITVTDQGHGIPKPFLDRITAPFFTTKGKSGGMGLGLSITDTIIKNHKGRLFFESEPERGTTVWVELPTGDQSDAEYGT
ncbi:MAG: PAS domain S-box protein [Magnetococcales bacterium]|nr:PAS domain S-box protein [Magnetococcales bacterium]MBF0149561.1 PAS domain S-box protein [Magnetococcales bacterium]MBF0173475.1 PAS domain S-box protein [Magnetococcales bacterium]MBF0346891.1 PAS domain S-box protein [Magnetococcales bacterium]MBF0632074.1 PAS domain S-box protein [Magnetococcales bacterium]